MKTYLIIFLLLTSSTLFAQNNNSVNIPVKDQNIIFQEGAYLQRTTTIPVLYDRNYTGDQQKGKQSIPSGQGDNNTAIRWTLTDPVAIINQTLTSGTGQYQFVSWYLNNARFSLYSNANNTPLWEYPTNAAYVSISDSGTYVAGAGQYDIYIFNRAGNVPVFDFNTLTLPDTGFGGPLALTKNGKFLVATVYKQDSSWIMGFSRDSTHWVWRFRVGETRPNGAITFGAKLSGNDSLCVINTYYNFYVVRTYTGQLVYSATLNPNHDYGSQTYQGISGNGNIVATVNNEGYVRVFQWNGTTYNLFWQHQEPPGTYYNWMTSVDVSYDGSLIASGTLNFITASTYDGKLKFFRTTNGSTPIWTYTGMGDEVSGVSFSKDNKILTAVSWGGYTTPVNNLLIFKTTTNSNVPIFAYTTPGSMNWCSTSNNGGTVIAGGKHVHARAFGNGGDVYNIQVDTSDNPLGITREGNAIPEVYSLLQNYPNPFNPSTKITYDIPKSGFVKLSLFDVLGRETAILVSGEQTAGKYTVTVDGNNLSSGIYFYKLESGAFSMTRKMVLIK